MFFFDSIVQGISQKAATFEIIRGTKRKHEAFVHIYANHYVRNGDENSIHNLVRL